MSDFLSPDNECSVEGKTSSLTSEEKREPSHGFPSLPGCEAVIDLGVAQLGVAVSFPSCPKALRSARGAAAPCAAQGPQRGLLGAKPRVTRWGSCRSWNWFNSA